MKKNDKVILALILTVGFSLVALAPLPATFCSPPQPCYTGPAFPMTTFPKVLAAGVAFLCLAVIFYFVRRSG